MVLVHGAATTPAIWARLVPLLQPYDVDVETPSRPASGDLDQEVAALAGTARDSIVVGVGGGATLGLALLQQGVQMQATLLHEPAAGSLAPGLLDHVAAGYAADGVAGFGRALYGPSWTPDMAPTDPAAVGRDLRMFRRFEPEAVAALPDPAVLTVGEFSPPARHEASAALTAALGIRTEILAGCSHFVQWDAPAVLATAIGALLVGT